MYNITFVATWHLVLYTVAISCIIYAAVFAWSGIRYCTSLKDLGCRDLVVILLGIACIIFCAANIWYPKDRDITYKDFTVDGNRIIIHDKRYSYEIDDVFNITVNDYYRHIYLPEKVYEDLKGE